MARIFAVMLQILLHAGAIAVQIVSEPEICHGIQSFIAGRYAYPDATAITNLSWVQELGKNRDKQLTFIVRVISRPF